MEDTYKNQSERDSLLHSVYKWQLSSNKTVESIDDLNLIVPDLSERVKQMWPNGLGAFLNDLAIYGLKSSSD